MSIPALALGGWISVYCGASLIRASLIRTSPLETKSENVPPDPRRKLAAAGYILVFVGLAILVFALRHHGLQSFHLH